MSKYQAHKNKNTYQNFLTLKNNCKTCQNAVKTLPHLNPDNILTDNLKQVWFSNEQSLPISCVIDLRNMIEKPLYYNRIGFYCWHQYESNPKLIQVAYSSDDSVDNAHWTILSKIRLELLSGWQHFKIKQIYSQQISFLKITINQNHYQSHESNDQQQQNTQQNTYLNQISLGYVQEQEISRASQMTNNNINLREKTFSDYRKLTSSEKEIKKLHEKMRQIFNENETLKNTVQNQNEIIHKLQQAMDRLAETVIKMQKVQHIQQKKIKKLQKDKQFTENKYLESYQPKKIQQFFNDESQITNNIESHYNNSIQRKRIKNNSVYQPSSQFSKGHSIHQRSIKRQHSKYSNNSKKVINANIDQSDSLSQYQQQRRVKQKKYVPMLQKLQGLILLRDEKKNKLKTQQRKTGQKQSDQQSQY